MPVLSPSPKTSQFVDQGSSTELYIDDRNIEHVSQGTSARSRNRFADLFRRAVLDRLSHVELGQLTVVDRYATHEFGQIGTSRTAGIITVNDHRFYRSAAFGGGLGAAESYIRGDWDSNDLMMAMRVLAQNSKALNSVEKGLSQLLRPFRAAANRLRRNTKTGSRRNISAHYDLSNDFFALMLDPTMTYSSGVFPVAESTLEAASIEKYDRICRKLQLTPKDHVLEIGTGWGGFAVHAARCYGCRITTTTISEKQFEFSQRRFRASSCASHITLLKQDYRDLDGKFDKLVSIEMIEAVGEKFLPVYFEKCSQLLKSNGMMLLQAITIPDDRYASYRNSVDFIQRYIFPGGFLPSLSAISKCVGSLTDFRFFHLEDFGLHYAETLAHWRKNFWESIELVRSLGFNDRFIRTWHYYLCYCEASFRECQTGVAQIVLTKSGCRRAPILTS